MKTCSKCQHVGMKDSEVYCSQCGSREIVTWQPQGSSAVATMNGPGVAVTSTGAATGTVTGAGGYVLASRGLRIGAFAIDMVIGFLISLLGAIPFINVLIAVILVLYWLFRDQSGASVGKRLLGLKVLSKSGHPATKSQLMIRNLPFVIVSLLEVIPGFGFLAENAVDLLLYLIELILVLATRNRLGDRIAGTMVVKA